MMNIDKTIFRAYDIRGIVDKNLTEDVVKLIGQAIGSIVQEQGENKVVIARDGRLSGPKLSKSLCEGILSSGCDVIDIGAAPTPTLYFATYVLNVKSGVVLTGSHNPKEYNGIKIVIDEKPLAGVDIQNLYQRIIDGRLNNGSGNLQNVDVLDRYIDRICESISLSKPLNIVIDCGNGIAGVVAPKLYKKLGCNVTELFCEVDGNFPNHHPDPSILENMKDLINSVKKQKADVGLAFDGDADRLGVVTNEGEIIFADRLLMLFAGDVLSHNFKAKVIYDVKCSKNLYNEIKKRNGEPIMYKTGHSFIKAKMQETGALLAGEMSGHVSFKDRWYGFDDGLYAGARLLEILSNQDLTSSEVFKLFPESIITPELKIPIEDSKKFEFMEKFIEEASFEGARINTLDGIRADFEKGWGLIRVSNTSPYLTLRFEADDEKELKRIQKMFKKELLKLNKDLKIPF